MDTDNSTIITSMMIDLEPNVQKVLMDIDHEEDISEIEIFQNQCHVETGDCRILRKIVDLTSKIALPVEVIVNINATDCQLMDFFKSESDDLYDIYKNKIISYVCKKQPLFKSKNGIDNLILRVINYMKPFEEREVFSLNLNFPENFSKLSYREKQRK